MKNFITVIIAFACLVTTAYTQNTSYQYDFTRGSIDSLPVGWTLTTFQEDLVPNFKIKEDSMGRYISLTGRGDPSAVAYISTKTLLAPGTYQYKVIFSISDDVNPQRNLLFQINRGGIESFYRLGDDLVEGRETIVIGNNQKGDSDIRILFRFNLGGEVKIRSISLTPTERVKPRWARFACTQDTIKNRQEMTAIAGQAAKEKADLLLFYENVAQSGPEALNGDTLMTIFSQLAANHRMYVGASIYVVDKTDGKKYNRGVLYDRSGKLAGVYDKIHPYSSEVNWEGITPGTKTDIIDTDFGKVGMIICYDSWFTDVAQLFALKGAEVILFPVAGYYRSLIPARCADNRVRFVISVKDKRMGYGIFDTAGRDVQDPDKDPTVFVRPSAQSFKDVRGLDPY